MKQNKYIFFLYKTDCANYSTQISLSLLQDEKCTLECYHSTVETNEGDTVKSMLCARYAYTGIPRQDGSNYLQFPVVEGNEVTSHHHEALRRVRRDNCG